MRLVKKGLLSDCEHLLSPLTTDQEGNLRGGFTTMSGDVSGATNDSCSNGGCVNFSCINSLCENPKCGNQSCSNKGCSNTECHHPTKKPEPILTPETTIAAKTAMGLLGYL